MWGCWLSGGGIGEVEEEKGYSCDCRNDEGGGSNSSSIYSVIICHQGSITRLALYCLLPFLPITVRFVSLPRKDNQFRSRGDRFVSLPPCVCCWLTVVVPL